MAYVRNNQGKIASFLGKRISFYLPAPQNLISLDNLVGYWKFDETSGTLYDSHGNLDSVEVGAQTSYAQSGKLGNSLSFNGTTSSYVLFPDVSELQFETSDVTFGCWFKTSVIEQQGIFGGDSGGFAMDTYDNGIYGSIFLGNTLQGAYQFNLAYSTTDWNFAVIIFDSTATTNNATLYLNGQTETITANFNGAAGAATRAIGLDYLYGVPFTGEIDEVFIFKGRKLTVSELDILYNNGNGLTYPFTDAGNQGDSSTAQQISYVIYSNDLIIADHTIVEDYDIIPSRYLDEIKKMWLTVPGESHSEGYRYGLTMLETANASYGVNITESGTPEAYTSSHLRASRATWGDLNNATGWIYDYGEEDWYTSAEAIAQTKTGITYCNTHDLGINLMGFGWCWDDAETYGADISSYIVATKDYQTYCTSMGYPTRVMFTTGPVDSENLNYVSTQDGYNNYLRWKQIRDYVKDLSSGILFDYADILCYDNNGDASIVSYSGNNYPVIATNNTLGGNVAHIGENGALRLGKSLWWTLARMAGWNGKAYTSTLLNGLGGYWNVNQTSGDAPDSLGLHAGDASGIAGITYGNPGILGNSFTFTFGSDGQDQSFLEYGNNLFYYPELTFSCWLYRTDDNASHPLCMVSNCDSNVNMGIDVWLYQGTWMPSVWAYNGVSGTNVIGDISANLNTWHHYVLSIGDGSIIQYLNNIEISNDAFTSDVSYNANCRFRIGANEDRYACFGGRLDEIGIWNRVLDASERAELYNYGRAKTYPFTNPTVPSFIIDNSTRGWYNVDSQSFMTLNASSGVTPWNDLSQYGNHLTQPNDNNYIPTLNWQGILFDNIDDYLQRGSVNFPQPLTVYMVLKQLTLNANSTIMLFNGGTGVPNILQGQDPGEINIYAGNDFVTISDASLGSFGILRVCFNGTNSYVQWNNNIRVTGNAGTDTFVDLRISHGDDPCNMIVKELILRGKADSFMNDIAIHNYLSQKYNISKYIYADDFQSYSVGNLGGQGNWVAVMNTTSIVDTSGDKRVYSTGGTLYGVRRTETFNASQYAQIVIDLINNEGAVGVSIRTSGIDVASAYCFYLYQDLYTTYLGYILPNYGGAEIATASHNYSPGDVLRIEINGDEIRAYLNGSLHTGLSGGTGIFNVSEIISSNASLGSGMPGIWGWSTGAYGDEWQGGNL